MTIAQIPFSEKQKLSFKESKAKINIWQGAVRSGKTYISLWRFLKEIVDKKEEEGEFLMLARTYDSIKRNIVPVLHTIIGSDLQYFMGKREMYIWGRCIHLIGCDDERAESKLRGMTALGAYVDEASILPESVVKMLVSRCAMKDAKIFMTTNPDSPFHWLKKDFIDDNEDVKTWLFTLDDNPEVTQETKEYLKRQYRGLWYQRFILGNWLQASGAIYDFFDPSVHVVKSMTQPIYSVIGIDYGTTNPTAFVLVSFMGERFPKIIVEKEYYWDSKEKQRQKTDAEYAQDLQKFTFGRRINGIYLDPSAASFKTECNRANIRTRYADNEVMEGIRYVANMISSGTVKILDTCPRLIQSIQSYVWDSKSITRGEDKPLKQDDHLVDALRYAIFTHFYKRTQMEVDWDKEYKEAMGENTLPAPFQEPSMHHQYF